MDERKRGLLNTIHRRIPETGYGIVNGLAADAVKLLGRALGPMPDTPVNPAPVSWTSQDIAFVATELSREFPGFDAERIALAVDAAAERVAPAEGRVRLTIAGRQLLRAK